ncbi:MAG: hypothetical protein WC455_20335 [Dehalococcoidia bacterium]|jgi:hypothetical protein
MKTDKPSHGSGKTKFNRGKLKGQSWTELREKAIKAGTWRRGQK